MAIRKRTMRTGAQRWELDYYDTDGRRRFEYFDTKGAAVDRDAVIRQEKNAGSHVPRAKAITLKQLWETFEAAKRSELAANTLRDYTRLWTDLIEPQLGSIKVDRLTTARLTRWRTESLEALHARKRDGVVYLNRALSLLVTLLNFGLNQEPPLVARNVAVKVPKLRASRQQRVERKDREALSKDQLLALFENCNDRLRPLVMVMALAGLRLGEALALRWEHVDTGRNEIRVRQSNSSGRGVGDVKSDTSIREVPMVPELAKAIAALPRDSEWLFPNTSGDVQGQSGTLRRSFKAALKAAELPDTTFHHLRHSFGSMLIQQGASIEEVRKLMGHASAQITLERYTHVLPNQTRHAISRLSGFLYGSSISVAHATESRRKAS